jgi:serpin B
MRRILSLWFCLLCSCVGTRTGNPTNADVPVGATLAKSSLPRETDPTLSGEESQTFAGDNHMFALDLYAELGKQPGNLFFSPYSIASALAMAYAGANGDTAAQMASTLHFSLPQPALHIAFNYADDVFALRQQQVAESQPGSMKGDGFQLNVVNQAWAATGFMFLDSYLDVLAENYGAGMFELDFGDFEGARGIINGWVSRHTAQRIPELLPTGSLSPNTMLVLTNAVYFKASWLEHFDPQQTTSERFHGESGDGDVSMMHWVGEARYASSNGYQAVARSFLSPSVVMLCVLPPEGQSTTDFDASQLTALLDALDSREVHLSLPKWKLDAAVMLKDALQNMGMRDAFDSSADFSAIIGRKGLSINQIYHSAFVSVDEQGVEAAAATAVSFADSGVTLAEPVTVSFDRPFIYLIYDEPTGQILFLGRASDL